jgi:hypothetical protein
MIDEDFTVDRIFEKDKEPSTKNTKDTKKDFDLFSVSSCDSWTEKENLSTKNTKDTKNKSDALEVDNENNKISVDFSRLYEGIDLAETLSCVKGKFIRRVTADSVEFADGEIVYFDKIDYRDILPLIWWDK